MDPCVDLCVPMRDKDRRELSLIRLWSALDNASHDKLHASRPAKQPVMARERDVPCSPAEAAGGKEAAGLTSEREWKAATGAAKVGRWLASIPHPAPPRSAYVSFVPPVTLLEKLLLLRSVPAERTAIGRGHITQSVSEGTIQAVHRLS